MVTMFFTACSDAGDRTVQAPSNENQKAPVSDPNRNNTGPMDKSTTGVQDSSTVIDYDTAARKKQ
ncbi:MAG: hypothetical protein JWP88_322 [Flaviaesturariibacter sp.]|nr:hypothetical protein [Flaviaesturariibacter sp.]